MTTLAPFTPSRADGRSDRQVIYDLTRDAEPGTVFTFDDLVGALQEGLNTEVDNSRAYRAVREANKTLLHEDMRYLRSVRSVGYRMARSDEHMPIAIDKRRSAARKLRDHLKVLRHTRLDELTEGQRVLHERQTILANALVQHASESNRRHDATEKAIAEIRGRLSKLEGAESS